MAIRGNYTTDYGIDLENAYLSIYGFNGNKNRCLITYHLYVNEQAKLDEKTPIYYSSCEMPYDDNLPSLTAAYNYLKTLPQFSNWTDA